MSAAIVLSLMLALQGQGTVTGRILAPTGAPAAGVRVGAMDSSEPPTVVTITVTGADGRYRLDELPAGRYRIFAGPLDSPTYFPEGTSLSKSSVVTVATGTVAAGLDFTLAKATVGFKVSGRVIIHEDAPPESEGSPVVSLRPMDGRSTAFFRALLARDGTFELSGVPAGKYALTSSFFVPGRPPTMQVAVVDEDVAGVELAIPRVVEFQGVVLSEDGQRLPALTVLSQSDSGFHEHREPDSQGLFQFRMRPGQYRVSISGFSDGYYIKSFSAGAQDLGRGRLTVADSDQRIRSVMVLARALPVRVSGRVTGGAGPPAQLILRGAVADSRFETAINSDRSFALADVLPGAYETTFALSSGLKVPGPSLVIRDKDQEGIELGVPPLQDVVGRVVVTGNGPGPRLTLRLFPSRAELSEMDAGLFIDEFVGSRLGRVEFDLSRLGAAEEAGVIRLAPSADGTFRISVPAGEYRAVLIEGSESVGDSFYIVRAVRFGEADLLHEPMKVKPSASDELRIELAPDPRHVRARVAGVVVGLDRDLRPGARVSLSGGAITAMDTPLGDDGAFVFTGIPPGSYSIRVVPAHAGDSAARVSVDGDVSDVIVPIPSMRTIRGRVAIQGNGPPAGFVLGLRARGKTVSVAVTPGVDGTFQTRAPIGEFRVRVSGLPPGYVIESLTGGATDLLRDPFTVGVENSPLELRATLTVRDARFVRVAGSVSGVGPAQTSILLTSVASSMALESPVVNGQFEFSAVPPGVYWASLRRNGETIGMEPSVVVVESADRAGIELRVVSAPAPARTNAPADQVASSIANLRRIHTAEEAFRRSSGHYGDIAALVDAGLLDARLENEAPAYLFSISVSAADFIAVAVPANPGPGAQGFYTSSDGVIRFAASDHLSASGQATQPVD